MSVSGDPQLLCNTCQTEISSEMVFCPRCGKRLQTKTAIRPRKFFLILALVAGIVWPIGYFVQPVLLGSKPTKPFRAPTAETSAAPSENGSLEERAGRALEALASAENPDDKMVLEAVDSLGALLQRNPNDSWALLNMAELSFQRRVFDKSAEMYRRYLAQNPNAWEIRARYANALSFAGDPDKAIVELDQVLKEQPENFQALAFAAIVYGQKGDTTRSKELANKALPRAPNEEARARLQRFIDVMDKPETFATGGASSSQGTSGISTLEAWLRQHPIVGPKFDRVVQEQSLVAIYVHDFPMSAMPQFARDKFNQSLKAAAEGTTGTLVIRDSRSGDELGRVER